MNIVIIVVFVFGVFVVGKILFVIKRLFVILYICENRIVNLMKRNFDIVVFLCVNKFKDFNKIWIF